MFLTFFCLTFALFSQSGAGYTDIADQCDSDQTAVMGMQYTGHSGGYGSHVYHPYPGAGGLFPSYHVCMHEPFYENVDTGYSFEYEFTSGDCPGGYEPVLGLVSPGRVDSIYGSHASWWDSNAEGFMCLGHSGYLEVDDVVKDPGDCGVGDDEHCYPLVSLAPRLIDGQLYYQNVHVGEMGWVKDQEIGGQTVGGREVWVDVREELPDHRIWVRLDENSKNYDVRCAEEDGDVCGLDFIYDDGPIREYDCPDEYYHNCEVFEDMYSEEEPPVYYLNHIELDPQYDIGEGWGFDRWEGDEEGDDEPLDLGALYERSEPTSLTAIFKDIIEPETHLFPDGTGEAVLEGDPYGENVVGKGEWASYTEKPGDENRVRFEVTCTDEGPSGCKGNAYDIVDITEEWIYEGTTGVECDYENTDESRCHVEDGEFQNCENTADGSLTGAVLSPPRDSIQDVGESSVKKICHLSVDNEGNWVAEESEMFNIDSEDPDTEIYPDGTEEAIGDGDVDGEEDFWWTSEKKLEYELKVADPGLSGGEIFWHLSEAYDEPHHGYPSSDPVKSVDWPADFQNEAQYLDGNEYYSNEGEIDAKQDVVDDETPTCNEGEVCVWKVPHYAEDGAGNNNYEKERVSEAFKIDRRPPDFDVDIDDCGKTDSRWATWKEITAMAGDYGSGLKEVEFYYENTHEKGPPDENDTEEFSYEDGDFQRWVGEEGAELDHVLDKSGIWEVTMTATDFVGNEAEEEEVLYVDSDVPETTLDPDGSGEAIHDGEVYGEEEYGWTNEDVDYEIEVYDEGPSAGMVYWSNEDVYDDPDGEPPGSEPVEHWWDSGDCPPGNDDYEKGEYGDHGSEPPVFDEYTETFEDTVTCDEGDVCAYDICYYAEDNAGNIEDKDRSEHFKIDKKDPVLNVSIELPEDREVGNWTSWAKVHVDAWDEGSGLDNVTATLESLSNDEDVELLTEDVPPDGDEPWEEVSVEENVTDSGEWRLVVEAYDRLGHYTDEEIEPLRIDSQDPEITDLYYNTTYGGKDGSQNVTRNRNVTFTVEAEDPYSGIDAIKVTALVEGVVEAEGSCTFENPQDDPNNDASCSVTIDDQPFDELDFVRYNATVWDGTEVDQGDEFVGHTDYAEDDFVVCGVHEILIGNDIVPGTTCELEDEDKNYTRIRTEDCQHDQEAGYMVSTQGECPPLFFNLTANSTVDVEEEEINYNIIHPDAREPVLDNCEVYYGAEHGHEEKEMEGIYGELDTGAVTSDERTWINGTWNVGEIPYYCRGDILEQEGFVVYEHKDLHDDPVVEPAYGKAITESEDEDEMPGQITLDPTIEKTEFWVVNETDILTGVWEYVLPLNITSWNQRPIVTRISWDAVEDLFESPYIWEYKFHTEFELEGEEDVEHTSYLSSYLTDRGYSQHPVVRPSGTDVQLMLDGRDETNYKNFEKLALVVYAPRLEETGPRITHVRVTRDEGMLKDTDAGQLEI